MESNLKNNSPSPEVLPAPSPVTVPEPITLPEIDPDDPFNVPGPKVDPTPKGKIF
ncbi:MAG: hypothetical protein KatS3mg035_0985 [Bacteroidia bacterium]|nr:MAG: hypothetical protein KatS3mg035_0985 [Bacteroidia bacterium]